MKLNYLIIPLITIAVAVVGSRLTSMGLKQWYGSIRLPSITPPGRIIGIAWTIIFILSAIAALIIWNSPVRDGKIGWILGLFIANAVLNVLWSYLFFGQHLLLAAVFDSVLLGLSVLGIILLSFPISVLAAYLLIPYFLWVCFATYLTYAVFKLN